jgi:hypothetical protein
MGPGGWHIQIDSDEWFVDFERFIGFLRQLEIEGVVQQPISVFANWVTLFKRLPEGILYIADTNEKFPVATNFPRYERARLISEERCRPIFTDFVVLHDSWARSRKELEQKLRGWSHSNDFDIAAFLGLWDSIDIRNFSYITDLHPLDRKIWKRLELAQGTDNEFMDSLRRSQPVHGVWFEHLVPQQQLLDLLPGIDPVGQETFGFASADPNVGKSVAKTLCDDVAAWRMEAKSWRAQAESRQQELEDSRFTLGAFFAKVFRKFKSLRR